MRGRLPDGATGVVLAVLFGAALYTRSPLLWVTAILVALLLGMVQLWARFGLSRVEYSRRLSPARCFPDDEVDLTLTVTNRKLLPLTHLMVDETLPDAVRVAGRKVEYLRSGQTALRVAYSLGWYQRVTRHFRLRAVRRGVYGIGPAVLTGGDPFGWEERSVAVEPSAQLIVYPRVLPLEQVGLPPHRPFGDLKSRNRLFEDPLRFAGVREYQPGDPPVRVHWKATAQVGRLQVKLLDPSAHLGIALFLNTWSFRHFWEGVEPESLEAGCVLAASVANWAVEKGLPVGLYANGALYGGGTLLRQPPARGPQVLTNLLEALARLQTGSPHAIWDLMAAEVPALPFGTSVVVITRQAHEPLVAEVLRTQRSGRPVTLVLTAAEPEPLPALPGVRVYHVGGEGGLHASVLAH